MFLRKEKVDYAVSNGCDISKREDRLLVTENQNPEHGQASESLETVKAGDRKAGKIKYGNSKNLEKKLTV